MQLVEQHIILSNNKYYKECDDLCFRGKNLYNVCLYLIKQENIKGNNILYNLYHLIKNTTEYKSLPSKVSALLIIDIQKVYKSYFNLMKSYKINPSKFTGKPKLPKYLDKLKGRYYLNYSNQAISKKVFKKSGKIKLSQSNIEFKTKIRDFNIINCVRIIPKLGYYVIEVVYTISNTELKSDNNNYGSIDLGVNNLATLTSNIKGFKPKIINGKPLKSINQYFNKELAEKRSVLIKRNKEYTSKAINKLSLKRKNKIDNYLHKASKTIIEILTQNNINTLIIGKNQLWKQESSMGKVNNQKFISIPHSRFIQMLEYKCEIKGINVILQEESYTSKASFLNLDQIPIYKEDDKTNYQFSGYRESRGIYKIKGKNLKINADVNGSYNIMRKGIPTAFANGIEGIEVCPEIIKILKN